MANENAVKNATYRSFEIIFHYFCYAGDQRLLGLRPPGRLSVPDGVLELGSEVKKGHIPAGFFPTFVSVGFLLR